MTEKNATKANPAPLVQDHAYDLWLKVSDSDESVAKEVPTKGLIYVDHLDNFYIFRESDSFGDSGVAEGRVWRIHKGWILAIADAA